MITSRRNPAVGQGRGRMPHRQRIGHVALAGVKALEIWTGQSAGEVMTHFPHTFTAMDDFRWNFDRAPDVFWRSSFLFSARWWVVFQRIHRMPRTEPDSPAVAVSQVRVFHPVAFNMPIISWLMLRGKWQCTEPISSLHGLNLTNLAFLACCLGAKHAGRFASEPRSIVLAGLIAATFIDFEHFIIPDEITLGGVAVGFLVSADCRCCTRRRVPPRH